jgi:hypothetical protein
VQVNAVTVTVVAPQAGEGARGVLRRWGGGEGRKHGESSGDRSKRRVSRCVVRMGRGFGFGRPSLEHFPGLYTAFCLKNTQSNISKKKRRVMNRWFLYADRRPSVCTGSRTPHSGVDRLSNSNTDLFGTLLFLFSFFFFLVYFFILQYLKNV